MILWPLMSLPVYEATCAPNRNQTACSGR
jgi:hypothetical protein